jgi:hypothetical protein
VKTNERSACIVIVLFAPNTPIVSTDRVLYCTVRYCTIVRDRERASTTTTHSALLLASLVASVGVLDRRPFRWIVALAPQRRTSQETPRRENGAFGRSELFNRLHSILRARGDKPTGRWQQGTDEILVDSNRRHHGRGDGRLIRFCRSFFFRCCGFLVVAATNAIRMEDGGGGKSRIPNTTNPLGHDRRHEDHRQGSPNKWRARCGSKTLE